MTPVDFAASHDPFWTLYAMRFVRSDANGTALEDCQHFALGTLIDENSFKKYVKYSFLFLKLTKVHCKLYNQNKLDSTGRRHRLQPGRSCLEYIIVLIV